MRTSRQSRLIWIALTSLTISGVAAHFLGRQIDGSGPHKTRGSQDQSHRTSINPRFAKQWENPGSTANLANSDALEEAFLLLNEPPTEDRKSTRRLAASYLAAALGWKNNPSRKLVLIQVEALAWNALGRQYSSDLCTVFTAFTQHAPDEMKKLEIENPGSMLVRFLKRG